MIIIEGTSETQTNLPLYQSFAGIECQHDYHVLADDCYRVGLLVQRETRLHAEKVLQRERCLRLTVFVAILRVPVELQMKAICEADEENERAEEENKH